MLDTNSEDAISELPEEVLGKILSSIPIKQAASTSVLAKKWRNLFTLVHNNDFDNSELLLPEEGKEEIRESFRNFVDRTLALQCGSPIKKFSLKFHIHLETDMSYVAPWISNAVERGVLELDLSIQPRYNKFDFFLDPRSGVWRPPESMKNYGEVLLPSELLTCKTLVKLRLGTRLLLRKFPPELSLPALKSLFIDSICFEYNDLCGVLLPGCPVLEELVLLYQDYEPCPYYISSRTIKRLLINYNESPVDQFNSCRLSLDAPNLLFLDYSQYALYVYLRVNLPSLVEARLDIQSTITIESPNISGLIKGISNVKILHLSPDSVDVIFGWVSRYNDGFRWFKNRRRLPVFNNLVSLSFGSKNEIGWALLPYLLEQSPKLETLIIQGLDSYTGDVTILPSHVKVLRVLGYGGTAQELENVRKFIRDSECLEVVLVEAACGP